MKSEIFIRKNNDEAKELLKNSVKLLFKQINAEEYEAAALTGACVLVGIGTVNAANDILSDN